LSRSLTPVELWGVLNVTPDSFSDGGRFLAVEAALAHAERMRAEGADVLDVGGESSRPPGRTYGSGASEVGAEEECARVLPVIEALARRGCRVSIDTVKAEVAAAAVRAGAAIINDVSCGRDSALLRVAAEHGSELVLMHNRGRGERSGANVAYVNVVADVREELLQAVERARQAGVRPEAIWLDPGVGFAKTAAQSAALVAATPSFVATGHRVLVGPSRKSFLAELTVPAGGASAEPGERLGGTAAAVTMAVIGGARAVRVHDVRDMHQAVRLTEVMLAAGKREEGSA
jgi:dihydropteroate synthase